MSELKFSDFGKKLCGPSGINQLMDDLGKPLPKNVPLSLMGGGNPARIPEIEAMYRKQMEKILSNGKEFEHLISHYDAPQGNIPFIQAVATYLKNEYGWNISQENIAITNGSQSAFFYLFNMFCGTYSDNNTVFKKRILFPLIPEYVGYADQSLEEDCFTGIPAKFTKFEDRTFKYNVDFDLLETHLKESNDIAALCVTRPTNPTGNVLTDKEILHLSSLSKQYNIPLFIDNAYGLPWPDIVFIEEAKPYWDENIILSMSLSKIGLPSLRTGIIIAKKEIIKAISQINAIASLASGTMGQALALNLIKDGSLVSNAEKYVKPFYQKKSNFIQSLIKKYFEGTNYFYHKSEGSMFIWILLEDLKISTKELYSLLKEKGVFVMPGEYFFFGSKNKSVPSFDLHPHYNKCLRLNFSGEESQVEYGIKTIASLYKANS